MVFSVIPDVYAGSDAGCTVIPETHNISLAPGQSVNVSTQIVCTSFTDNFTNIVPDTSDCGGVVSNDFGVHIFVTSPGFISETYTNTHTITYNGDGTPDSVSCDIVWSTEGDVVLSATQTIEIIVSDFGPVDIYCIPDPIDGFILATSINSGQYGQTFIPNVDNIIGLDIIVLGSMDEQSVQITIREGTINGPILGTTTKTFVIPVNPIQVVHFDFPTPIALIPGNTYVFQTSQLSVGDSILVGISPFDICQGDNIRDGSIIVGDDFPYATYFINVFPDITDPLISCPADISINEGDSTNSSNTGSATAIDDSGVSPTITFSDVTSDGQITRTWKAQDGSGNMDICDQIITILSPEEQIDLSSQVLQNPIYTGGTTTIQYELSNIGNVPLVCNAVNVPELGEAIPPTILQPGVTVGGFVSGDFFSSTEIKVIVQCDSDEGQVGDVTTVVVQTISSPVQATLSCDPFSAFEPNFTVWTIDIMNLGTNGPVTINWGSAIRNLDDGNIVILKSDGPIAIGLSDYTDSFTGLNPLLAGTYLGTINISGEDDFGDFSFNVAAGICVVEPSSFFQTATLIEDIEVLQLPKGTTTSLVSLLDNLLVVLNGETNGNLVTLDSTTQTAESISEEDEPCDMIQAVINKIEAQSGKKIDEGDAVDLIEKAEFIQELLQCDTTTED